MSDQKQAKSELAEGLEYLSEMVEKYGEEKAGKMIELMGRILPPILAAEPDVAVTVLTEFGKKFEELDRE